MVLKEIVGQVTSSKMNKTVTVAVSKKIKHKKYSKIILKTKKYYVHDEYNQYQAGDTVEIRQTRPISKYKCWTVIRAIN
jgi:small subunit ribosomal protein S17